MSILQARTLNMIGASEMDCRDIQIFSRRIDVAWISLLVLTTLSSFCRGDDLTDSERSSQLRGEFTIGKEGRLILLPIELDGKRFQCLLDTGACRSAIDSCMRQTLGKPMGSVTLRTAAGHTKVQTFDWPEITLDGQTISSDLGVAAVDFTELRQASNEKIFGVIGMDILRNRRMQVDFDRGILRFLDSLPKQRNELGTRIPLKFTADGAPYLVGDMTEDLSESFVIDTGAQGNSLDTAVFDQLTSQNHIRLGGSFASMTVAGEVKGTRGYLDHFSVGPISHDGLRFSRVNMSSLGLRYFSRYLVTFDFPDQAIYLRDGLEVSKPEPHATSGMALLFIDGNVVVKGIKRGGPAERAGIRPDDVVLLVDGKKIAAYDHFSLRHLMTHDVGKKVQVQVRRAGREINVEVILEED